MHDFDWDVLQKKRIANNARRMKNGSKSKKCSLPSDYMTPAEWKRRNGPVNTYKLDAPMSWGTFKEMPIDLQITYLRNLQELYRANDKMLADMFHVHFSHIAKYRTALGVHAIGGKVVGEAKERRDAMWAAFCNGVVGGNEKPAENVTEEPENVAEEVHEEVREEVREGVKSSAGAVSPGVMNHIPLFFNPGSLVGADVPAKYAEPEKEPEPMHMDYLNVMFKGVFDPVKFTKWISQFPIPDGEVRIKVEVTSK